jgi:hypothetical protein
MEETMEVLKLSIVLGVRACSMGGPILVDELGKFESSLAGATRALLCLTPMRDAANQDEGNHAR